MKSSRPTFFKKIALLLAGIMLLEAIFPAVSLALTSGPSQPEMHGFQPIGTTDMVDLFTGNFSYNIPLCDVDGYPLNLSYQSDPGMDQEASWVGLGWSLNPGVMNREVRGYPDDFKEEAIKKEFHMRPNVTVGVGGNTGLEFFGMFGIGANKSIRYNNYRGFDSETGISAALQIGITNRGNGATPTADQKGSITVGADLSFSSSGGLDIGSYASLGFQKESGKIFQGNINSSFNSRQGLKEFNYATNLGINSRVAGILGSGTINFSGFSYFPTSPLPLFNQSYALDLKGGGELFGAFPNYGVSGYYTEQRLLTQQQTQYAYGYLHLAAAKNLPEEISDNRVILLDYNSERKGVVREETPNLPLSYGTYDLFTASGQGMSGQFRAVRNDIGLLHPARHTNTSTSAQLGGELGVGFLFETGGRVSAISSVTTTQAWKDKNQMYPYLRYTEDDKQYESVFFKNTGEPTLTDANFQTLLGGDQTIHSRLSSPGNTIRASRIYDQQNLMRATGSQAISSVLKRSSRESRNQVFSYLTNEEASKVGLEKSIRNYDKNKVVYADTNPYTNISRTNYPDHHISEVSVLQNDGGRYVYGLPVYNHKQREVTFSVEAPDAGSNTFQQDSLDYGLVSYTPNKDNTVNNKKGQDHYFDATELPAYAHSHLLTAVLSPDYVDRTGDGVTDDDTGNAVKFNYSQAHQNFKWRIPFQENKARYHEGYQSWGNDDKASYLYGEKEIWYLHSIESRTMVAHFHTSSRNDGLGVSGENGGLNTTQTLEKLDSIRLYSKSDLISNPSSPVPIKTIHFEYYADHEGLCQDIPNTSATNGGKLTLKRLHFTYGNNQRGRLNAYEFSYKNKTAANIPFDYNTLHTDRWGMYKQNPESYPRNDEFPYSLQDTSLALDDNAAAWNLNQIQLPSGGVIDVTYESDDYAYVQDKRAGQMFFIQGFANDTTTAGINNQLYSPPDQLKNYLVVGGISSAIVSENLPLERFFKDVEKLYFKAKVDLDGAGNWDYVSGYMNFDRSGVFFHADRLYIPIQPSTVKGAGTVPFQLVHPMSLAAYQLMRLELPHLIYDGYDLSQASPGKIIKSLLGFGVVKEIQRINRGFERQAMLDGQGKTVDLSHSWVRLSNPTYRKFGGGSRVKELRMSDGWTGGGGASEYGQIYTYTEQQSLNGESLTISSGVAAYEPLMGGEENLMRNPLPYREKVLLAPDNFYYTEAPIGETLFPAPGVGYSKVRVESIPYPGVSRTGTGYSTSEFYTARDFPVRVDMSRINPVRNRPNAIERFFKIDVRDQLGMSQGFVIEVNDMHGKPKSSATYDHTNSLLARTDYHYRTKGENRSKQQLSNMVEVVDQDNTISEAEIGVDLEVWQEMMEETNETKNMGADANLNGFLAFIWPVTIPTVIPIFQKEVNQLRTSVTTKLIKRYGMLEKVSVMENGSSITTENMLYDKATGSVLLTKTQNEFDDAMYQFSYPAHWAYEGMAQAYQNINGIYSDGSGITNGILQSPEGFDPLVELMPGDEVIIQQAGATGIENERYWVTKPGSDIVIMDRAGEPLNLSTPLTIKVIRSGRRNQAGVNIGSFTSRIDPTANDMINTPADDAIIESSALTFKDQWQMLCPDISAGGANFPVLQEKINPYAEGLSGNWRPHTSYIFYGDRSPSTLPNNSGATNIRVDGTIKDFAPFWVENGTSGYWEPTIQSGWTKSNEITVFDQRGNEVENEDALGIPSGALFGYDQNRVVGVAGNARQFELVVDGFEDYDYQTAYQAQAPYRTLILTDDPTAEISDQAAHTGTHSLLVGRTIDIVTYGDSCNLNTAPQVYLDTLTSYCDEPPFAVSASINTSATTDDQSISTLIYTWDFGDGSATQQGVGLTSANHTYTTTGSYTITVTAEDDFGAIGQATTSVQVVSDSGDCILTSAMPPPPAETTTFANQCSDCLPKLRPIGGKAYWLSVWIATDTSLLCGRQPNGGLVTISFDLQGGGSPTEVTLTASGPVVEGWQKIEGKINVPADYLAMTISLENDNVGTTEEDIYYDDFRFHPWQSNMQSYVYDPVSMRLMATLDENNYANFYEYDDEGILVRVKRETEKGVMTVQETRTVMGFK